MSSMGGDIAKGAGTGAATGAAAGTMANAGWGTLIGAGVGAVVGGVAAGVGHSAAARAEEEAEEAQNRYNRAMQEYFSGSKRLNAWQQAEQQAIAEQQWANEMRAVKGQQTGQQAAATLQGGYAKALEGAKDVAASAAGQGPQIDRQLQAAFARDVGGRITSSLSPQAHEIALGDVKRAADAAAMAYGMDKAKLNRQLADISNLAGVEKAALAAKFAAATGQYPLDMMEAQQAGQKQAALYGLILGGAQMGASAYGQYQRAQNYNPQGVQVPTIQRAPSMVEQYDQGSAFPRV